MTYKLISVVGDGVTREWTLDNELVDGYSVLVDGAVVVFTQPAWNRVKMASAPAAGSNVTFKVKELASTDASGSTGGTGSVDTAALASAVAAAVQVPSAAAIATAVASQVASDLQNATDVLPGQIVQFKEGQVPAGYAQVSGPAFNPSMIGIYGVDSPRLKNNGVAVVSMCSAGGRMFAHLSGALLQEVDGTFSPLNPTVVIPYLGGSYTTLLIPLSDGSILRYSGTSINSSGPALYQYTPSTGVWVSRSSGASTADAGSAVGCQAGDNRVYVTRSSSDFAVDMYDPSSAQWTLGFDTLPISTRPYSVAKLPSGSLLFVFATAQYIFNPQAMAGSRWTQVGGLSFTVGGAVSTAYGARYYELGATVNSNFGVLVVHSFDAATTQWTTVYPGIYRPTGANPGNSPSAPVKGSAFANPYTGATVVRAEGSAASYGADACLLHYLNYTPAAKVDAVKL